MRKFVYYYRILIGPFLKEFFDKYYIKQIAIAILPTF
jgi:hypothetical protein